MHSFTIYNLEFARKENGRPLISNEEIVGRIIAGDNGEHVTVSDLRPPVAKTNLVRMVRSVLSTPIYGMRSEEENGERLLLARKLSAADPDYTQELEAVFTRRLASHLSNPNIIVTLDRTKDDEDEAEA